MGAAPLIRWEGTGIPVLFFPGWNTTAATVCTWLPEAFLAHHRCGVLEWPGFGEAEGQTVPVELEAFLDAVAATVPDPTFAVAGFCLGGVTAWAFARRHPDRVCRIIAAESPLYFPAILAPLLVPGLGRLILALAKDTGWGRALVRRAILRWDVAYPEAFHAGLFAFRGRASLAYVRLLHRYGRTLPPAPGSAVPCLRLVGEAPPAVLRPALGPRHDIQARVQPLPGTGHFPAVEAPEAFFTALAVALSARPSPVPSAPAPGR